MSELMSKESVEQSNPQLNIVQLEAQLKELEASSKLLSKQIGQAKKSKDPGANELIEKKKAIHAQEIDPLKAKIKELKQAEQPETTQQVETLSAPSAYTALENQTTPTSSYSVSVKTLRDYEDLNSWNQFVDSHPMGGLYYRSDFLESIQDSLGHRILLFTVRNSEDNALIAALPIIEQKSRLFGHLWTSIALVNYGGTLSESKEAEEALLDFAQEAAKQEGVKRLEVRGLYERPISWNVSTEKASMWLRLPPSHRAEELLNSFKAKLRSQIKKGYTDEVSFKVGGIELLDDYYLVFARNMRDLGTPVYGKNLFKGLLTNLGKKARLVIIYYSGKPASAAFLIQNKQMMEIPWASTIRDYNRHNLNMVLYWEVLKFSCERQCEIFDFGRSSIDATTYRFKKQWGAQPIQHYWYSYEPNASDGPKSGEQNSNAANTNNPKFQLLIAVWKRLPLKIANLIGPHIVKYIP